MHFNWSILCGVFFLPDMASAGQGLMQAPQALQAFSSMV